MEDKQMVVLKKQLRKKCSAEGKTKFSSATKNDPESKKTSKAATKKKKVAATPKKDNVTFSNSTKRRTPLPQSPATRSPPKRVKALEADPKAVMLEEAPEGAELGHEIAAPSYDSCQVSGRRI